MQYETIKLEDVRRGDKVRPPGWPRARVVKQTRLMQETGSIWLWFPSNVVHWGPPTSDVERAV